MSCWYFRDHGFVKFFSALCWRLRIMEAEGLQKQRSVICIAPCLEQARTRWVLSKYLLNKRPPLNIISPCLPKAGLQCTGAKFQTFVSALGSRMIWGHVTIHQPFSGKTIGCGRRGNHCCHFSQWQYKVETQDLAGTVEPRVFWGASFYPIFWYLFLSSYLFSEHSYTCSEGWSLPSPSEFLRAHLPCNPRPSHSPDGHPLTDPVELSGGRRRNPLGHLHVIEVTSSSAPNK